VPGGQATIFSPSEDLAIKTSVSNMAMRRSLLVDIGGFDPRLGVHLGVADLNLRLATRGLCTTIVPQSEVHQRDGRVICLKLVPNGRHYYANIARPITAVQ
jgi:GT2 family glycosyltransferase